MCVTLHIVMNFETIIRLQGIESLLLRWAVLEQIQWDSWAGQEQSRQLDERCCSLQCITNIKTIEKLRLKNGILLTMNPTEHTGWIIVDVWRMTQATISVVTIARAVAPFPKRMNTKHALPTSGSTDSKFSELTSGSIYPKGPLAQRYVPTRTKIQHKQWSGWIGPSRQTWIASRLKMK